MLLKPNLPVSGSILAILISGRFLRASSIPEAAAVLLAPSPPARLAIRSNALLTFETASLSPPASATTSPPFKAFFKSAISSAVSASLRILFPSSATPPCQPLPRTPLVTIGCAAADCAACNPFFALLISLKGFILFKNPASPVASKASISALNFLTSAVSKILAMSTSENNFSPLNKLESFLSPPLTFPSLLLASETSFTFAPSPGIGICIPRIRFLLLLPLLKAP